MHTLLIIIFTILGLIIGSFLNVVIFRHGTGMGLGGRSRCMSSGQTLRWYELVPVFSFILQRGRSLRTGAKLSWQYPLVEIATALLFAISYIILSPMLWQGDMISFVISLIFFFLVSCFVVLISVYDIRHMIIPNAFIYPLIVLSFMSMFFVLSPFHFSAPTLLQIVSGPLVALPFVGLWYVSGGRWMGFADAKIGLALGWFLGISSAFAGVILACFLGAVVGSLVLLFSQDKTNHHIPFGPFLLTGFILSFLYTIDMYSLVMWFI